MPPEDDPADDISEDDFWRGLVDADAALTEAEMPCPTCNATLQNLGVDQPGRRVFWCPNCGTLKWECADGRVETDTPKGIRVLATDGAMSGEFDRWELDFGERNRRLRQGA